MVGVVIGPAATTVTLIGHGLAVGARTELASGIVLCPPAFSVRGEQLQERTESHLEYAAILGMGGQADFGIEIGGASGQALAVKAWNAQWLFGLLSLAIRRVCCPLFAFCDDPDTRYTTINRNLWIRAHERPHELLANEVAWARTHVLAFDALIRVQQFSNAFRAFSNAYYLFDLDQRLMLLWAGIEGLLGVEAELRRRIALHASILLGGPHGSRVQSFERIKRAYDFRSKIVHGSGGEPKRLAEEYEFAVVLLAALLARCVELGRVPTAKELDEATLAASL